MFPCSLQDSKCSAVSLECTIYDAEHIIFATYTNKQEISAENELQIISGSWNTEISATISVTRLAT